ncbi:hypothetical protein LJY25_14640 [Hymenobacter sp. BT175]|uniref:hypothetical protein n=1 Tax=Hymenobacter translucens TaxID=2886507 RepID=UPI001D0DC446|nr:hypothetical protein [Hymenobacter translucens]MCC2547690.1 hypothetical protein [Hymenobacter translucens]
MLTLTVPRPKPSQKKAPANYRVPYSLREKFRIACEGMRSTPTLQVTGFMQDFVAAYEKAHGPITLPAVGGGATGEGAGA